MILRDIGKLLFAEKFDELTKFIKRCGRYKYFRVPMGLTLTGDKYNLFLDAAVGGLDNQKKAVDDILLYTHDFKEHVAEVKKY